MKLQLVRRCDTPPPLVIRKSQSRDNDQPRVRPLVLSLVTLGANKRFSVPQVNYNLHEHTAQETVDKVKV